MDFIYILLWWIFSVVLVTHTSNIVRSKCSLLYDQPFDYDPSSLGDDTRVPQSQVPPELYTKYKNSLGESRIAFLKLKVQKG